MNRKSSLYLSRFFMKKVIRSLPAKSIIKKENLLQAKWGNGTVEGKVLFLVNENIASPIHGLQGE
ncbi:hypothetical protein OL548_27745 [Lysinibacillus sp. MHQ-1]|nr:hypothetical protein OL548_27745 [Lysinibacillus sp. MHQ-1]